MNKISIIVFTLILYCSLSISAQNEGIFDYRKVESPAISWNGINLFDAKALGLADISLFSGTPFSQITNPAFVLNNQNFSIGLSINTTVIQAFQYWGLNQGVFSNQFPLSKKSLSPGAIAFQFAKKQFNFTIGFRIGNLFSFPDFGNNQEEVDNQNYILTGEFTGQENVYFVSGAYKLSDQLNLGIGFEYFSGTRNVNVNETESNFFWDKNSDRNVFKNLITSRNEIHKQKSVRFTLGGFYKPAKELVIGAYVKIPFRGTTTRNIQNTFENDYDSLLFEISDTHTDPCYKPILLSVGTKYKFTLFKSELTIAFETNLGIWKNYQFLFFSEEMQREMRNTINLKIGVEYPFLMGDLQEYFRFGFKIEQQPVKTPAVSLNAFSFGTGIQFGKITLDLGFAYYFSTSLEYNQQHFIGSCSLLFSF